MFETRGGSFDACSNDALKNGRFTRDQIVCIKTLYNYADEGLLKIKNIDLPEKVSRLQKHKRVKENRMKLGDSIEERPDVVESREGFGHWEFDSVLRKTWGK